MVIHIYMCVWDDHVLHACRTVTNYQLMPAFYAPSGNLPQAYIRRVSFNSDSAPALNDYLLLRVGGDATR